MRLDARKAQFAQVDGIYEGVDQAHHIVLGDHLVQRSGKEAELLAVLSDAVAHAFFIGDAGRRCFKDSSILQTGNYAKGFFSQSDGCADEGATFRSTCRQHLVRCILG